METKYFQSRYNEIHRTDWDEIKKSLGVNVYDVVVPCELAVILGGYFENPNAFKNVLTLCFYKTDEEPDGSVSYRTQYETWRLFDKAKYGVWVDILKNYYDEMVDLTGLTPHAAAAKIRKTVETYQS
jgi:hypothetical protein